MAVIYLRVPKKFADEIRAVAKSRKMSLQNVCIEKLSELTDGQETDSEEAETGIQDGEEAGQERKPDTAEAIAAKMQREAIENAVAGIRKVR